MKVEAKKAFWINVYNALVLHGGNHFSKVPLLRNFSNVLF
jgi:hypothetical protein